MFMDSRCHVILFFLLIADPRKSTLLDIRTTRLTSHTVCVVCVLGVKEHIFLQCVMLMLLPHGKSLSPSLQQVQTCVWDVATPFKIVLVNGSKVNAEETAKVNYCFVDIHEIVIYIPGNVTAHPTPACRV